MHTRPKKIIVCLGLPVTLCKRLGKGDQDFFLHWIYWARYDNVTLIPLVLQLGLRIGPIQRMGAN